MMLQKEPSTRTRVGSTGSTEENSSSGLRRSGAASEEQALPVQHVVGEARFAVLRDAGERRRKRTSKSSDVNSDTRRSNARPEAAGDGGMAMSDVRPDVDSINTTDHVVKQKVGGSDVHVLNGHVDSPVMVAKDATAVLPGGPRISAKDRRTFDDEVVPRRTSDHKETTSFTATSGRDADQALNGHVVVAKDATASLPGGPRTSAKVPRTFDSDVLPRRTSDDKATKAFTATSRDSGYTVNGYQEAPVAVAKDATAALPGGPRTSATNHQTLDDEVLQRGVSDHETTTSFTATSGRDCDQAADDHKEAPAVVAKEVTTAVTGGTRSSVEDHQRAIDTEAGTRMKDDQQMSSLPLSIEHQTDIKPVNPDMVIFDVLHRQQTNKRDIDSGSEEQNVESPRSRELHHVSDVETSSTVGIVVVVVYCSD